MNPVKFFYSIATWTMRVGLMLFAFTYYLFMLKAMDLTSLTFYTALVITVFSVLLFIGGVFNRHTLTVVSSIFLIVTICYQIIISIPLGITESCAIHLLAAASSFFFLANGNK